ncbi:MAG: 50S ribosomal protein L35 [Tenericutes bacterium]|jgi:ribosomal protein L35|nr:50S ribosomal protein L35 [Mycoplasmatota bacterium]
MPKIKTHKGTSKKMKVHKSGTVTIGRPGLNHKTGKKNTKFNLKKKKGSTLSSADRKRLKNVL